MTIASRPPVDRWRLAELVLQSTVPLEVARATTGRANTQATADITDGLRDFLIDRVLDQNFFDPERVRTGASFAGWMRQSAKSHAVFLRARHARVRALPTDPTELHASHEHEPGDPAVAALRGLELDTFNAGPLRRVQAGADALSVGLGVPKAHAKHVSMQTRRRLLAALLADPRLAMEVTAAVLAGQPGLHDPELVGIVSGLPSDGLEQWLERGPWIPDLMLRAAVSPNPQPPAAPTSLLAGALAQQCDSPTAKRAARDLVRAWAAQASELTGSEFSNGSTSIKTDAQIAEDERTFARAVRQYVDAGGPGMSGKTPYQVALILAWNAQRAVRHLRSEAPGPFTVHLSGTGSGRPPFLRAGA